jgi:hypothetical protein
MEAIGLLVRLEIDCTHVFQYISSYIDNEMAADLRADMEVHFKECKHCAAVLDGTRNIIQLIGDERAFDVPSGFSERLYRKIPKKSCLGRGSSASSTPLPMKGAAMPT